MVVKRSTKPGKSETSSKKAAATPEMIGENVTIMRNFNADGTLNTDSAEVVETLLFPERARIGRITLGVGGGAPYGASKGYAQISVPALLEELDDGSAAAYAKELALSVFGELADVIGEPVSADDEEDEKPKGKKGAKAEKEAPAKKGGKKKPEPEEEEEDEDAEDAEGEDDDNDDITEEDIREMSRDEIVTFIEEWVEENGEIETDPDNFKKNKKGLDELKEALIAELFEGEDGEEGYTEEDLEAMDEAEIKVILKELGLTPSKSKKPNVRQAENIAAIMEAQEEAGDEEEGEED